MADLLRLKRNMAVAAGRMSRVLQDFTDDDGLGKLYEAVAVPGTLTTTAAWAICEIEVTAIAGGQQVTVKWASGTAEPCHVVPADFASLSYS